MQKTLWLTIPLFLMILDYTAPCCKSGWVKPPPPPPPCCCCCCCDYGWGTNGGWPPSPGCEQPEAGGQWGGQTQGGHAHGGQAQGGQPQRGQQGWGRRQISDVDIPWTETVPEVKPPNKTDARPKFLAAIATADEQPVCSGTILSKHFVVTTCVRCLHDNGTSVHPDNVRVMVMDAEDQKEGLHGRRFIVYETRSVMIHPSCVQNGKYDIKHDVGLVQTVDNIKLNSNISPAKLPQKKSYRPDTKNDWILAAYHGKKTMIEKEMDDAVSVVRVPSVDPKTCKRVLNSTFYNATYNYCTPYHHHGRVDNCEDDFGAALSLGNMVFGLLIHKFACGRPGSAGSFVSLSYNSDWIRKSVRVLSDGTERV